jgi:hypothetical protein
LALIADVNTIPRKAVHAAFYKKHNECTLEGVGSGYNENKMRRREHDEEKGTDTHETGPNIPPFIHSTTTAKLIDP